MTNKKMWYTIDTFPLKRLSGAACLFAAAVMFCACASAPLWPAQQVKSSWRFPKDKAVLVGRIELHPPLQESEQKLVTKRAKDLRNVFILSCGDRILDLKTAKTVGMAGFFSTTLEKEFFIKVDKGRTLYLSGGIVYRMDNPTSLESFLFFQSPFQVEMQPDDEAVYIGTIQLYRDENNVVTSVFIRDDYAWADAQFKLRFGAYKTLRKALAVPVFNRTP